MQLLAASLGWTLTWHKAHGRMTVVLVVTAATWFAFFTSVRSVVPQTGFNVAAVSMEQGRMHRQHTCSKSHHDTGLLLHHGKLLGILCLHSWSCMDPVHGNFA